MSAGGIKKFFRVAQNPQGLLTPSEPRFTVDLTKDPCGISENSEIPQGSLVRSTINLDSDGSLRPWGFCATRKNFFYLHAGTKVAFSQTLDIKNRLKAPNQILHFAKKKPLDVARCRTDFHRNPRDSGQNSRQICEKTVIFARNGFALLLRVRVIETAQIRHFHGLVAATQNCRDSATHRGPIGIRDQSEKARGAEGEL